MGSKAFNGVAERMNGMAQKLRIAKTIPDKDFDKLAEFVLEEDRGLLEKLAKV